MASDRPNVLLITCDQMRGDCLGMEHPVVETPNLDHLARQGMVFSRAYSAVPSCIAARAGILTGMNQHNHGRVGYEDGVPWSYKSTLPGLFAEAGYHTQGIGKMHFHPARSLCGFHNVVLHDGYLHFTRKQGLDYGAQDDYLQWLRRTKGLDYDLLEHGLNCNSWVARPWPLEEHLHPTNWVVSESIDFLRRRDPTKPFFLWMSFVRPHPPFDPPANFFAQYIDQTMPEPAMGTWAAAEDAENHGSIKDTRKGIIGDRQLQRARAAYYGLITHMDHQIGRFLEALNETGELQRTVILFTSDHGELLGDHNLFRKALPYEGSARVPFIVSLPNHQSKRRTSDIPVELQDVLPTLLEASGISIPDGVDGRSVLPEYKDDESLSWRQYIHGEHAYGEDSNHFITDGKCKYIWFSQTGQEQFFDLVQDPQETVNLIESETQASVLHKFRQWLIDVLREREEGYVANDQLVAGRSTVAVLRRNQKNP